MPSNMFHPEEWPEIVKAIQAGDTDIGARLADRERRFDNYFNSAPYTPVLKQGGTTVGSTVNYCNFFRIGVQVLISVEVVATGVGPGNQDIKIFLPGDLPAPIYTSGMMLAGNFTVRIASSSVVRHASAWISVDFVCGYVDNTSALIGTSPAITLAVGDAVSMAITYPTTNNPLV